MDKNKLKIFGRELMKGNFGLAVKSLSYNAPLLHNTYHRGETFFWGPDGTEVAFNYANRNSALEAFMKCPPLTNIITRKAQAYVNGKTFIMNTQGKEANSPAAKQIKALFKRPNPLQSQKQFEAQQYIYQQLFGYSCLLLIKPVGFEDPIDATSMWNIPPFMLEVEETDTLFYQTTVQGIIKMVSLLYKGKKKELKLDDLWFFKDFIPSMYSPIWPESRVCGLSQPINNIIGAFESRGELINYRGARGILTPTGKDAIGNQQLTDTEKEQIHSDFKRYGLRGGQRQFLITSTLTNWIQIGQAVKDLMLFEEIADDTMQICDAYGYPYRLLSQEKSASYNDVMEFKKLLYQDTIFSEADSNYEQWNLLFKTEHYNLEIIKDYSHVACLQDDKQKEAATRKTLGEELRAEFYANLITYNRVLELLGEDTRPGFDKYYFELIAEGMIFTLPQIQQNGQAAGANGQAKGLSLFSGQKA